ncbi:Ribonuclease D protein [Dioscorea alata]|uniref:Ribonuclease D protein n=1 Tax=Dioscorea alata TaxID=55571 RepID=A0ACB7UGS3_DIOAL|nr:Ribonuclease D protein [Dioscorea alata]
MESPSPVAVPTHLVTSGDSPEFSLLRWALQSSSIVALDAEWKPSHLSSSPTPASPSFPAVTLLQIACRIAHRPQSEFPGGDESLVFLVDLLAVPFSSVEPFLDITTVYHLLKRQIAGKRFPKETKSLATICEEILNISLSKELQVSDWSFRPLTEEQISYAAADAYFLLEIFAVLQHKFFAEGPNASHSAVGLKEIVESSEPLDDVLGIKFCKASDMIESSVPKCHPSKCPSIAEISGPSHKNIPSLDEHLLTIIRKYGERIILTESDRKPRNSRRKGKQQSSVSVKFKKHLEITGNWQGLAPWDSSVGGDGCPKFLCDIMVEGLAKHLRCVGIDAAIPSSKKPDPRHLLDQAYKEKRVILTRDSKLSKHQYLIQDQIYLVKSLLKNDQLLEVIETFQLKITEEQLMSRCTKCNGRFIQKPLTMEEAIAASKGFQVIPNCLFNRAIEFWQCTDCKQLYWEGTQYHNAIQKFVNVCKLSD